MRFSLVLGALSCIIFIGCEKKFESFEPSPMASLMEEMYVDQLAHKNNIQENKPISGTVPSSYDAIFNAEITDPSLRTADFAAYAQNFINAQKTMFQVPVKEQKQAYINAVQSCVVCHENIGCRGPLARIKTLEL